VVPVRIFAVGFILLAASWKQDKAPTTSIPTSALFGAVLGVLVHNLIDFAIFEPGVFTILCAIMAVLIALDFNRDARPQLALKPTRIVKMAAVALALVLAWAYLNYALIPVAATAANTKQAYQAASIGQFAQAHDSLAVAADEDRLDPTALSLNGRLYMQHYTKTGEKERALLEKARECFLRAIDRDKADFKNYEKLSTVCDLLGETQNAYDWCLEATKHYPGSGRLRFKLAKIAEKLGKKEVAVEQYRKAVEIEQKYRAQFRLIYPERKEIVSRLGEDKYQFAMERMKALKKHKKED
jgi:tetratricopeptide (TPR) repeat protein